MMGVIANLILFSTLTWAHTQTYGPLNFDLPEGWLCRIQDSNMACLDQKEGPETAAMVLSYKEMGPEDKLDIYKNQLSQPRMLKDGENVQPSEVRSVREIDLNGIKWVEGVHYSSEITDYYTHYFVTAVEPYAFLISISVHKSAYPTDLAKLKPTLDSIHITVPAKGAAPTAAAPAPSEPVAAPLPPEPPNVDDLILKPKDNKKYFVIGQYKIPRPYAFLAIIFILVVLLLGYAILA